jgi:hypothetical protein
MKKGQVSTEYLIILAIVIVIAVMVVFVLKDFLSTGSSVSESQSRSTWAVATPFSVSSQKYSGSRLDLQMQNALSEGTTITNIEIEGLDYPMNEEFRLGEDRIITIMLIETCGSPGEQYSLEDIFITYEVAGTTTDQGGNAPLVGTCS